MVPFLHETLADPEPCLRHSSVCRVGACDGYSTISKKEGLSYLSEGLGQSSAKENTCTGGAYYLSKGDRNRAKWGYQLPYATVGEMIPHVIYQRASEAAASSKSCQTAVI